MQSPLNSISNSLPLDTLLILGFYLLAIVYLIFTAVLYYHWQEYSINKTVNKTTALLYLCTTLPLIIIMGISTWLI